MSVSSRNRTQTSKNRIKILETECTWMPYLCNKLEYMSDLGGLLFAATPRHFGAKG